MLLLEVPEPPEPNEKAMKLKAWLEAKHASKIHGSIARRLFPMLPV